MKPRKPHQLSGGQQQRVALARALIKRPKLLLLDEPLGALDKKLREETQFELINIQESLGITFVVVTHDQEEAMTLSTRLGVMQNGRLSQVGTPHEIYEYPQSRYVADFIGSINLFEGRVKKSAPDHLRITSEDTAVDIHLSHGAGFRTDQEVCFALRPEKVEIARKKTATIVQLYQRRGRGHSLSGRAFGLSGAHQIGQITAGDPRQSPTNRNPDNLGG